MDPKRFVQYWLLKLLKKVLVGYQKGYKKLTTSNPTRLIIEDQTFIFTDVLQNNDDLDDLDIYIQCHLIKLKGSDISSINLDLVSPSKHFWFAKNKDAIFDLKDIHNVSDILKLGIVASDNYGRFIWCWSHLLKDSVVYPYGLHSGLHSDSSLFEAMSNAVQCIFQEQDYKYQQIFKCLLEYSRLPKDLVQYLIKYLRFPDLR